jgi:hypothetical protein
MMKCYPIVLDLQTTTDPQSSCTICATLAASFATIEQARFEIQAPRQTWVPAVFTASRRWSWRLLTMNSIAPMRVHA